MKSKVKRAGPTRFQASKIDGIDMLVLGGGLAALGLVAFVGSGGGGVSGTQAPVLSGMSSGSTTSAATSGATTPAAVLSSSGGSKVKDAAAFVIGEAMVGSATPKPFRPVVVLRNQKERSTASDLAEELRKAKSAVKEGAVGDDLAAELRKAKSAVKEGAVGDDLEAELRKAKSAVKEGFRGESELPPAARRFQLHINKQGFGQMRAPIGGEATRNATRYGESLDNAKYQSAHLNTKTVEADISGGSIGLPPALKTGAAAPVRDSRHLYNHGQTYSEVVEENQRVQAARNQAGFAAAAFSPPTRTFATDPGYNGYFDLKVPHTEFAQANDMGSTSHQFEKPGGSAAIGQNEWEKKGTNWEQVRGDVLGSVKNICRLFDRLFSEEIFPEAVVDIQDNGQMYLRDGKEGKCIRVDRYYEYVQQSVMAQLALGRAEPLPWGRSVELGFDAIEQNKDKLRAALTSECGKGKSAFIISDTGEVKTAAGEAVSVTLPWPRDGSTLYDHPMVYKKQE